MYKIYNTEDYNTTTLSLASYSRELRRELAQIELHAWTMLSCVHGQVSHFPLESNLALFNLLNGLALQWGATENTGFVLRIQNVVPLQAEGWPSNYM